MHRGSTLANEDDEDEMIEAFGQELVSRVTKLSRRQLEYWDQTGVVRPSIAHHDERGLPRLYSFGDLIRLKVAAELRRRHSRPSDIKKLVQELEERGYDEPLLALQFVGDPEGGRAFWVDPRTRQPMSARSVDQTAEVFELNLKDLRSDLEGTIWELTRRSVGEIARVRSVQGSQPVIAGTRVPVAKLYELRQAGWNDDRILYAFPNLQLADLDAAFRYEADRRQKRTA